MRCLRCSRETESDSCFCDRCLADMEQHPVASGTPVFLPNKPAAPVRVPVRIRTQEEEIADLRRRLRRMRVFLCCALLLTAVLASAVYFLSRNVPVSGNIGQNYSSTSPSSPPLPGSVSG